MKVLVLLCTLLSVLPRPGAAQSAGYTTAYATLQAMLTGKQQLDFTHAVFVVENAWYAQPLPEAPFTQQLVSIAQTCQRMVQQKNLQQHRTAGNWAIFMWMTQKVPENNQQPFRYNFEDFTGKADFSHTFVTRTLQDHTGTCLSLPLLYKCVAQRMGIEARCTLPCLISQW